ncbi:MAG: M20/M25/M40 family metallo-hydrolase [Colwellia sp.]|uniref:M20/M25/M40 family metallo-hydrolase n=1 Tax=Colwellia sp. TaxID=56799 RepID=UPI0025C735F5|nr:M20/M25/M40 family metallo-hydrolase [Colwellia sp.]NQZ28682.1 M20/M25/M40 family metallo-hydrolase [Colwellia sp.]
MNKLLTGLFLFSGIILSSSALGQQESTDKKVWISIGADAAKLIDQQYQGFINLQQIDSVASAILPTTTIAHLPESQIDRLSELMHEKFNRCGGFFYHENLAEAQAYTQALTQSQTQLSAMVAVNYSIDNATTVDSLLSELTAGNITATIDSLASYHNRYYSQQTGADAAIWLKNKWSNMASERADISIDFYQHSWKQPSVIATITGSTNSEEIVIVGGHLDSINGGNPNTGRAPGADDNASGIAVITETLRAIIATGFKPERTIKIIAYAAEEVGLRGSKAIAQSYKAAGNSVVGVVQFDMTANKGSADKDIVFMTDYTNDGQNQFLVQLIDTYLPGISYGFDQCGYGCSDHASWHNEGYATSMPFESRMNDINGKIHTDNDSTYNVNHIVNFTKLSMSYIGELAKGDTDSTSNPTDQLQNGVAKTAISASEKQQLFYTLEVPAGAAALKFKTSGGTGDADLFVKFGAKPSLTTQDCKSTSNGNTESCDITNIQAGTYHVMVEAWSAISGVSLTASFSDGGTTPVDELQNGVAKSGISGAAKQQLFYTLAVPANATALSFSTSGGSGDADLYVKFGAKPSLTTQDCKSTSNGNTESCDITNVQAGTYHVMVEAWSAISGVTLTGSYTSGSTGGNDPINDTLNNISVPQGQWQHYTQVLPAGYANMTINISGGTGDADLYIRHGAQSTSTLYECRPYLDGNTESCSLSAPAAGTWYLDVYGYQAVSGLTLTLQANP